MINACKSCDPTMRQFVLDSFQIRVMLLPMISSCKALRSFTYYLTTIKIIVGSLYELGDCDDDDGDGGTLFRKISQDNIDQTGKMTLGVWLVLPFFDERYVLSGIGSGSW